MNAAGQYLMLQRTYPDDEFEDDYYYIETSDPDRAVELENVTINLYRKQFLMTCGDDLYEINISVDDNTYKNLKLIIVQIVNKQGTVHIHD